jgi:hypothetical protein
MLQSAQVRGRLAPGRSCVTYRVACCDVWRVCANATLLRSDQRTNIARTRRCGNKGRGKANFNNTTRFLSARRDPRLLGLPAACSRGGLFSDSRAERTLLEALLHISIRSVYRRERREGAGYPPTPMTSQPSAYRSPEGRVAAALQGSFRSTTGNRSRSSSTRTR